MAPDSSRSPRPPGIQYTPCAMQYYRLEPIGGRFVGESTAQTSAPTPQMLRFLAAASLAAAQICPESHPHECSAPTTDSYGPCCDLSADCQCKPAEWIP